LHRGSVVIGSVEGLILVRQVGMELVGAEQAKGGARASRPVASDLAARGRILAQNPGRAREPYTVGG
jgi:hypothetical protein